MELLLLPTVTLFFLSAILIYFSCELFVNGVEWTGRKLGMGQTATGTLLAAFGTALPESAVTLAAVVFGTTAAEKEIGVGAALGGPLVLATLSYAVVGLVLIKSSRKLKRIDSTVIVNQGKLSQDQLWFVSIFVFKLALGLIAFQGKHWLAFTFIIAYGFYVRKEMNQVETLEEVELAPLRFRSEDTSPSLKWCLIQTICALGVTGFASHFFVQQLDKLGPLLGIPPQMIALFFSPIATELPETMNAIIWVKQGKEKLALANISGAMMIQATIPSALGVYFTPWLLTTPLITAGIVTLVAIACLFGLFRFTRVRGSTLAPIGILYLVFIVLALSMRKT